MASRDKQLDKLLALLDDISSEYVNIFIERLQDMIDAFDQNSIDAFGIFIRTIRKFRSLLYSRRWQTRCAAGRCIEIFARKFLLSKLPTPYSEAVLKLRSSWLKFDKLNAVSLLKYGSPLRSKAPKKLFDDEAACMNPDERLRHQRKQLLRVLGQLEMQDGAEINSSSCCESIASVINGEDIAPSFSNITTPLNDPPSEILNNYPKLMSSWNSNDTIPSFSSQSNDNICLDSKPSIQEILLLLANDLVVQLFEQNWEARHGAAAGLLGLLRAWSKNQMSPSDILLEWSEDASCACLCLLMLDRFADFGSGIGIVAPIRESAAQSLGLAASLLPVSNLYLCIERLQEILMYKSSDNEELDWEARHGAQLAVLYLAILLNSKIDSSELITSNLCSVLAKSALCGLGDSSEDVCAASAKAFYQILLKMPDSDEKMVILQKTAQVACKSLGKVDRDDLSASISPLIRLIESCVCHHNIPWADFFGSRCPITIDHFSRFMVPWNHTSPTVRTGAANILTNILSFSIPAIVDLDTMLPFKVLLHRCMIKILIESDSLSSAACMNLWKKLSIVCMDIHMCLDDLLEMYLTPDGQLPSRADEFLSFLTDENPSKKMCVNDIRSSLNVGNLGVIKHRSRLAACEALASLVAAENSQRLMEVCSILSETIESAKWSCQREAAFLLLAKILPLLNNNDTFRRIIDLSSIELGADDSREKIYYAETKELDEYVKTMQTRQLASCLAGNDAESNLWRERAKIGVNRIVTMQEMLKLRRKCAALKCTLAIEKLCSLKQLNPILRPLMDSIKMETDNDRHDDAACTLSSLLVMLSSLPVHHAACSKLLSNLLKFLAAPATTEFPQRVAGAKKVIVLLSVSIDLEKNADDFLEEWTRKSLRFLTDPPRDASHESLCPTVQALALLEAFLSPLDEDIQREVTPHGLPSYLLSTLALSTLIRLARGGGNESMLQLSSMILGKMVKMECFSLWDQLKLRLLPDLAASVHKATPSNLETDFKLLSHLIRESPKSTIVPYASILLPIVLRGSTNKNSSVRHVMFGLFTELSRAVSLSNVRTTVSGKCVPKRSFGVAFENLTKSGDLIIRHLVVGEPLELLNLGNVPDVIRRAMSAELRSYQWEGVTWCNFMRKIGTSGILADEMGLGKTLQALVAAALYREERGKYGLPVLVVCPPTLVNHWQSEALKYLSLVFGDALIYAGSPKQRKQIESHLLNRSLVITSYSVVMRDWIVLSQLRWSYMILDEVHLLRNPASAVSVAVGKLMSDHRLALTGTPIQNTVSELWAIFNLLMPGYLGEIKDFKSSYVVPTRAVLDGNSNGTTNEVLEGMRVLDRLHRQVLPFILRREKKNVLKDLPPKIITDIHCNLTSHQQLVHSKLYKSAKTSVSTCKEVGQVFRWLNLQQLACIHPDLVLEKYPIDGVHYDRTRSSVLHHSCKLIALRQIFWDCGIGLQHHCEALENLTENSMVVHKCLVFAHHKSVLDITEKCLLIDHLSSIKYLRLDGSTPQDSRADIVEKFVSDPLVSVLLLTTSVGGLGLNLSAADTVIFLEHNWNPQVDLQAMDRAHRIGQNRAVNVFRIIAKDTLEERIMSLQRGKIATAEKVVSAENSCLWSMNTESVLDLFCDAIAASGKVDNTKGDTSDKDDSNIDEEYDMFNADNFTTSVKGL